MNKALQIIIVLGVVIIVAAGSFYVGTVYGQSQASATAAAQVVDNQGQFPGRVGDNADGNAPQFQPGARAGRTAGPGGGGTFGQIAEIDGGTLTITTRDGNQIKVLVTDTTLIEKYASVSATDLETGETVIISGSANEDGSITARSLQVAPAGRTGNLGRGIDGNDQ